MRYAIEFKPSARKQLLALPLKDRVRVARKIDALADNPFPPGMKKLEATPVAWRIRVGDYRVIYEVQGQRLTVLVLRIGHRRDVYR